MLQQRSPGDDPPNVYPWTIRLHAFWCPNGASCASPWQRHGLEIGRISSPVGAKSRATPRMTSCPNVVNQGGTAVLNERGNRYPDLHAASWHSFRPFRAKAWVARVPMALPWAIPFCPDGAVRMPLTTHVPFAFQLSMTSAFPGESRYGAASWAFGNLAKTCFKAFGSGKGHPHWVMRRGQQTTRCRRRDLSC